MLGGVLLETPCQHHYAGAISSVPMNDIEALTLALRLAVTASTEEKAGLALEHALATRRSATSPTPNVPPPTRG